MEDNYQDIIDKCDLELVFLKCWAFGEVKKIQGPTGTRLATVEDKEKPDGTPASKAVIPSSVTNPNVIPGNVRRRSSHASKQTLPVPPRKSNNAPHPESAKQWIIPNWMMDWIRHHPP